MRRVILKITQSPGDVVMLTAAVREVHRSHTGPWPFIRGWVQVVTRRDAATGHASR